MQSGDKLYKQTWGVAAEKPEIKTEGKSFENSHTYTHTHTHILRHTRRQNAQRVESQNKPG